MPGIGARRWAAGAATFTMLALSVGSFGADAQARGGYWQKCGDQGQLGAGWYSVRAHKIACRNAHGVARHWWDSGGDSRFDGWRCKVKVVGYELAKTDCKRMRRGNFQRVKFESGA